MYTKPWYINTRPPENQTSINQSTIKQKGASNPNPKKPRDSILSSPDKPKETLNPKPKPKTEPYTLN